MKKVGILVLVLVLFSAFVVTQSEAGEKCWQISGAYLKTSTTSTQFGHILVNGILYIPSTYVVPVVGTFEKDADGVHRILSLHGTNNTTSFGSQRDCIFDAILDPTTTPKWGGTFNVDCGASAYVQTGFSITRIACGDEPAPASLAPASASAPGLGQ